MSTLTNRVPAPDDQQRVELPSWIFDIDEEDEEESKTSLLEELEIDPAQIYR